jgi:hypothetical protein
LKNFTTIEDEGLCSAYLNVSKDPIVGVNQPLGAYWDMIKSYIDENNKTTHSRSKSSLAHRWGDIQKDTSRFCECFVEIKRKQQSGKSEDDKVRNINILSSERQQLMIFGMTMSCMCRSKMPHDV